MRPGRALQGVRLEEQFSLGEDSLLLVDEDCPFGAAHDYLLGADLEIKDQRTLAAWYTPGFLDDTRFAGPRHLCRLVLTSFHTPPVDAGRGGD